MTLGSGSFSIYVHCIINLDSDGVVFKIFESCRVHVLLTTPTDTDFVGSREYAETLSTVSL